MARTRQPLYRSAALGLLAGAGAACIVFVAIVLPLFFLARATDPSHGTSRPFVRVGLTRVAVPAALLAGGAAGVLAAVLHRRRG